MAWKAVDVSSKREAVSIRNKRRTNLSYTRDVAAISTCELEELTHSVHLRLLRNNGLSFEWLSGLVSSIDWTR